MRELRDLENRIKFLKDKITLMTNYKEHYLKKLGKALYFVVIDDSLDELKQLFIQVEKLKKDENK